MHKPTLDSIRTTGAGDAAALALHGREFVPGQEHEEVAAALAAAKEQLVEALEELDARDRELTEVGGADTSLFGVMLAWCCNLQCLGAYALPGGKWHGTNSVAHACLENGGCAFHCVRRSPLLQVNSTLARSQERLQAVGDQVAFLYREHAAAASGWRAERTASNAALSRALGDAEAAAAANAELSTGLAALEAALSNGDEGVAALKRKYTDTVRRMAVVQVSVLLKGASLGGGVTLRSHHEMRDRFSAEGTGVAAATRPASAQARQGGARAGCIKQR